MFHFFNPLHPHHQLPASLPSFRESRGDQMQAEHFKKQRSPAKNQTSGIRVDVGLRRCETMRPASTSKYRLQETQHHGAMWVQRGLW